MFTPLTVEDYNFKHIKPTHRQHGKEYSASAGRTRAGSLANISPKCVPFQSSPAKNQTYGSQQLMQSNEFLRCKLRTAEASVTFLTERIKVLQRSERQHEENMRLQEMAVKETQEQLRIITTKYKALKKAVGDYDRVKKIAEDQADAIKKLESEKVHLDTMCGKYSQELKTLKENSDTERLLGENHELNRLVQQMRPELRRLTDILQATNIKLERFEQEKKQLTKELFVARMEKQSIYRLFDKCDGKTEESKCITVIEAYNELVMRWAQLLQQNQELQLQKVHFKEELIKRGWKDPTLTIAQPKKDKKFHIPPLNFAKGKTIKEVILFETVSSCSIGCSDREQVRIIDSEQSCEIVTPGTVKRAGAIRSMAGKLVTRQ